MKKKNQVVLVTKIGMDQIDLKNVNFFELFDELMESYCQVVLQSKYEKTLKKIGEWVDEARESYGIKKKNQPQQLTSEHEYVSLI